MHRYDMVRVGGILLAGMVVPLPLRGRCTLQDEAKQVATDAMPADSLGIAISASADTVLVGAYREDDDDLGWTDSGAAYVFVHSDTGWSQEAKLTAPAVDYDYVGCAVALDGDTALLGAYGTDRVAEENAGAAYVFVRANGVWTAQATLTASDAAADDAFGFSLGVSGDTAIVGAFQSDPSRQTDAGAAYVFVRSGGTWTQQARLTAADHAPYDYFGRAVALSEDTAVIGAPGADQPGGQNAGAAYVFKRSGETWAQQAKLITQDAAALDNAGFSVALDGDTAVVGAVYDDHAGGSNAGSAYVFVRMASAWSQQAKLIAPDAAPGDVFGRSAALAGDYVVIGANQDDHDGGGNAGSVYGFSRSGGAWNPEGKWVSSDAAASDAFGTAVAITGTWAAVGSPNADAASAVNAGAAYVYAVFCRTVGDLDADGDVDASDAALWFGCLSGPESAPGPGCDYADLDGDGDADVGDFAVFQQVYQGP